MKTSIKCLLVLFSLFAGFCPYAWGVQKEGQELIDSLLEQIPKKRDKNAALAPIYASLGIAYNYEKDFANAYEYFAKARTSYEESGNPEAAERMKVMVKQTERSMSDEMSNKDKDNLLMVIGVILVIGLVVLIIVVIVVVRGNKKRNQTYNQLREEKKKSDDLLRNVLPAKIAGELKSKGMTFAEQFDNVTVLITDFASFTTVAEKFSPNQLVGELHACFKAFDEMLDQFNIEKIKTVGDAYLAVAGLPTPNADHAANAVAFALHMQDFMVRRKMRMGDATFQMRIGLHTGSVIAGIVGTRKFAYDIWGDTVNTAARMEQNCEPGRINLSHSTYELIKDKFPTQYRGEIEAKKKGLLKMYYVGEPNSAKVTKMK